MDCRLCGGRGHIQSHCPDTWRRFHASTSAKAGLFVPDIDVHVPAHQAWCCNCARQGQYIFFNEKKLFYLNQCTAYTFLNSSKRNNYQRNFLTQIVHDLVPRIQEFTVAQSLHFYFLFLFI